MNDARMSQSYDGALLLLKCEGKKEECVYVGTSVCCGGLQAQQVEVVSLGL